MERRQKFFVGLEGTERLAFPVIFLTRRDTSIDHAPFGRCIFVPCALNLREDGDNATRRFDFEFLPALKTGLLTGGARNYERRFVVIFTAIVIRVRKALFEDFIFTIAGGWQSSRVVTLYRSCPTHRIQMLHHVVDRPERSNRLNDGCSFSLGLML